jgi:hypothetical protein
VAGFLPCQSFHRLLPAHHQSSSYQRVADEPIKLSLTKPQTTNKQKIKLRGP